VVVSGKRIVLKYIFYNLINQIILGGGRWKAEGERWKAGSGGQTAKDGGYRAKSTEQNVKELLKLEDENHCCI